jgi:predicted nuclease of predicted toxin-antitoxin system
MKLLLDQGLPLSAARFLREAGIDAIHVSEIGCSSADDTTILQRGFRIEDILEAIDDIAGLTKGMSYDSFSAESMPFS